MNVNEGLEAGREKKNIATMWCNRAMSWMSPCNQDISTINLDCYKNGGEKNTIFANTHLQTTFKISHFFLQIYSYLITNLTKVAVDKEPTAPASDAGKAHPRLAEKNMRWKSAWNMTF